MSDKFEKKYLNLFDKIKLNHWPDYSMRERKYGDLRELAFNEYKDTPTRIALGREYHARCMWPELFKIMEGYDIENDTFTSTEEKAYFYMYLAGCYRNMENLDTMKAMDYYKKAIALVPNLRDPQIEYGSFLCDIQCYAEAEALLEKCLEKTTRIYSWLENPENWTCNPHIWLTVACYYQGKYVKALGYAYIAKLTAPENATVSNNLKLCEERIKSALN